MPCSSKRLMFRINKVEVNPKKVEAVLKSLLEDGLVYSVEQGGEKAYAVTVMGELEVLEILKEWFIKYADISRTEENFLIFSSLVVEQFNNSMLSIITYYYMNKVVDITEYRNGKKESSKL